MMNWFSKQPAIAAEETDADRLQIAESEYREAERRFDEACVATREYERTHFIPRSAFVIGGKVFRAMIGPSDPAHQLLKNHQEHMREERGRKLRVFAEMKMERAASTKGS